jgi:capsular polysaccharide biosynthesis protein
VAALTSYGDGNYFHWLFDVLPRLQLLRLTGCVPERLFVACKTPFHRETLELLGLDSSKVINASETAFIEAEKLIVPSLPGVPGVIPGWVCEFLRESFLPPVSDAADRSVLPKRLMILRSDVGNRRFVNEAALVRMVERLGFVCVRPEKLSFIEQVRLFQNATVVVSPHGAGLSNLVFCAPETRVLEIFAPSYVNICYWDLSQKVRLRYSYLLGKGDQGTSGVDPQGVRDDIEVDLDELERAIAALG